MRLERIQRLGLLVGVVAVAGMGPEGTRRSRGVSAGYAGVAVAAVAGCLPLGEEACQCGGLAAALASGGLGTSCDLESCLVVAAQVVWARRRISRAIVGLSCTWWLP